MQASAPCFMGSQNQYQYQTPGIFSGQSSGAQLQTQIGAPIFTGAPNLMASEIQHGTLSSSCAQDSLPSYGMAQERGALNQEAAETSYDCHPQPENLTIGTQIQAQQEDDGGSGDPHGEGGAADDLSLSLSLNYQAGTQ
ncbi:hypothetical protein SUGI_1028360 [Cryptomeria japonica]|nr:hypothetical protein SUGI_1028360 [Cryptomeria japonica]